MKFDCVVYGSADKQKQTLYWYKKSAVIHVHKHIYHDESARTRTYEKACSVYMIASGRSLCHMVYMQTSEICFKKERSLHQKGEPNRHIFINISTRAQWGYINVSFSAKTNTNAKEKNKKHSTYTKANINW